VTAPRVLILRALGLGDLLTGLPALRALARAYPCHERLLATPASLAALLPPGLVRLLPAGPLEPLPPEAAGADVAVNLHGRGPQSHRLLAATQPRRALWFANPAIPQSGGAPAWRPHEHEVARWCRMLREHGITADPSDLYLDVPAGSTAPWTEHATVIHPGAASAARRWPAERFAAVARAERDSGRDVVVTGTAAEARLAHEVADGAGLPPGRVLAGRTDLAALARAIAAADRVVCGDTGVAHLATALRTPSVMLFGPVSPQLWGPPVGDSRHRVLWAGREGDPHGRRPDPGLLEISVDDVLEALAHLRDTRTRPGHRPVT
jgi:ADP-heptose:LPS heptosyltransferase